MPTQCNPDSFALAKVDGRQVVAAFDGGPKSVERTMVLNTASQATRG